MSNSPCVLNQDIKRIATIHKKSTTFIIWNDYGGLELILGVVCPLYAPVVLPVMLTMKVSLLRRYTPYHTNKFNDTAQPHPKFEWIHNKYHTRPTKSMSASSDYVHLAFFCQPANLASFSWFSVISYCRDLLGIKARKHLVWLFQCEPEQTRLNHFYL